MNRLIIEKYKEYPNVQLYTIRLSSKEFNETDDFILRFKDNKEYIEDFQKIITYINKIGENGVLERYFRPENNAQAIPVGVNKLRFYCYRINDNILILGNGGVKTSQTVQDSMDCYPHFVLVNKVAKIMEKAIKRRQVSIENKN